MNNVNMNDEEAIKNAIRTVSSEEPKIRKLVNLNNGTMIVLFESRVKGNNIICLDYQFNIVWQIQRSKGVYEDPFTYLSDNLTATDWATRKYQINPYTGESVVIGQYEFTSDEDNRRLYREAQKVIKGWSI